jgi:hypothetical protein
MDESFAVRFWSSQAERAQLKCSERQGRQQAQDQQPQKRCQDRQKLSVKHLVRIKLRQNARKQAKLSFLFQSPWFEHHGIRVKRLFREANDIGRLDPATA